MNRIIIGIIIAPLIWPFFEVYIAGVMYILMTGTTIELSWNVGFHNLHRYWWGYGLMVFCGIPLIFICKKYHWHKLWHFLLGAGLLGLIAPVLYWVGSAIVFQPQDASVTSLVRLVMMGTHTLFSGAITLMLVFLLFWFISVKNNEWYTT